MVASWLDSRLPKVAFRPSSARRRATRTWCRRSPPTSARRLTFDSPFDRYMAGDQTARSARSSQSVAGRFQRPGPMHVVPRMESRRRPLFTDDRFPQYRRVGARSRSSCRRARRRWRCWPREAEGCSRSTSSLSNRYERARPLPRDQAAACDIGALPHHGPAQSVSSTEPYFHDGSQDTVWDTLDHYNKGGVQNPLSRRRHTCRSASASPQKMTSPRSCSRLTSPEYAARAKKPNISSNSKFRDRPAATRHAAAMGIAGRNGPGFAGPSAISDRPPGEDVRTMIPPVTRQLESATVQKEKRQAVRHKSIETKYYADRDRVMNGTAQLRPAHVPQTGCRLDRRRGDAARASSRRTPFQLIEIANAAVGEHREFDTGAPGTPPFAFAYISDAHLYERTLNQRFVRCDGQSRR